MNLLLLYACYLVWMGIVALVCSRGLGAATAGLKDFGNFMLEKAPGPLVDLIENREGAASRIWMMHGAFWMFIASSITFVSMWLEQDPKALDAFKSWGWVYDSSGMMAASQVSFVSGAASMLLLGSAFHVTERMGGTRLVGQRLIALISIAWSLLTVIEIIAAFTQWTHTSILFPGPWQLQVVHLLLSIPILVSFGLTGSESEQGSRDISTWFFTMASAALVWVYCISSARPLFNTSEIDWLLAKGLEGWWLCGLAFGLLSYIVPHSGTGRLWSRSLASAGLIGLMVCIVPFGSSIEVATPGGLLRAVMLCLMALSLLPITATSLNIIASGRASFGKGGGPGVVIGVSAALLFLLCSFGSIFTSGDAFGGNEGLEVFSVVSDRAFHYGALGITALAACSVIWPQVNGRHLLLPGRARTAWLITLGSIISATAVGVGVGIASKALIEGGITENILQNPSIASAIRVESFLFYGVIIGSLAMTVQMITTAHRGPIAVPRGLVIESDVSVPRQIVPAGEHSMRSFLSMGLTLDTILDFNPTSPVPDIGTTTVNLEDEEDDDDKEADEDWDEEIVLLAHHVKRSSMSVFEIFQRFDINGDGVLSPYEFREGLAALEIANLDPWDMDRIIRAIDINRDGSIDLPELDILVARINRAVPISQPTSTKENHAVPVKSENESPHTESSLKKKTKNELVEIANTLGVSPKGTKSDLISNILSV